MSRKNDKLNNLRQEQRALMEKQFKETADQMGWDLKALEKLGLSQQEELKGMQDRLSKAFDGNRPDPHETLKSLIPNAREFSRARDIVFYKPDPSGPVDVQTDGPLLDVNIPSRPVTLCFVRQVAFLDTSADHGTDIQYHDFAIPGSDPAGDSGVIESASFNPAPGVNSASFNLTAAGKGVGYPYFLEFAVSFWFNFIPPENGAYTVRPTAFLAGSGHGSAWGFPNFANDPSLQIAFRTTVYQDDGAQTEYAHDNIILLNESGFFDKTFAYQTPASGRIASVSANLTKDLQTYIQVSCIATVRLRSFGTVSIYAQEPNSGLRVPEVHVERLDCSGRVSLNEWIGWGEERRRQWPDPRDWMRLDRE